MANNLVIVAIPEEQDRVWKISSEKVPHLTLLFLGDADSNPNVETITEFVQHAVDISEHGQFYLEVDRRDVLGPDNADVVFFSKRSWNLKWITQFRNQLLQQDAIRTAYDSTTQYPEWQPHLTLGYPTAPAKTPQDDYPLYSVCFDRIAVWMGDFEGPEFRLEWPDRVSDSELAVAYSGTGKSTVDELLHVGVKGMKWGVRKENVAGAAKTTVQRIAKAAGTTARVAGDVSFEFRTESDAVQQKIARGAHEKTKAELPGIKAKHGDYAKLTNRVKKPLSKEARAYRKDVKAAFLKNLEASANEHVNPSGTRRYTLKESGQPNTSKHMWEVTTERIQHATDGGGLDFKVHPIFDDQGYIVDFEYVSNTAPQTATHGEIFVDGLLHNETLTGVDLAHHGIKGMHWGVRKAPPSAVAPSASSHVPHGDKHKTKIKTEGGQNHPAHEDAIKVAKARVKLSKSGPSALSNQELRDVATRIQLEQQVKQLTTSSGKKFVKRLFGQQGNQFANEAANKAVRRAATKRAATAVLL